jgi:hypothetical protein
VWGNRGWVKTGALDGPGERLGDLASVLALRGRGARLEYEAGLILPLFALGHQDRQQ